jgi:S1-C subfamily serine protease
MEATHRLDLGNGGHGTAFVLTHDGTLLTCWHVIDGQNNPTVSISVDGAPAATYVAKIVKSDEKRDLAVLKIDRTFESVVVLGSDADVTELDQVYLVGFPYYFGELAARGYVMAKGYGYVNEKRKIKIEDALVVDIVNGHGTSGAGVFLVRDGRLIGMMRSFNFVWPEGYPFMVVRLVTPVDQIRAFLDEVGVPYLAAP